MQGTVSALGRTYRAGVQKNSLFRSHGSLTRSCAGGPFKGALAQSQVVIGTVQPDGVVTAQEQKRGRSDRGKEGLALVTECYERALSHRRHFE